MQAQGIQQEDVPTCSSTARGGHNHTPSSAPTRHPVPMGSAMLSQNGVMEGGSECGTPSRGCRPIPPP